MSAVTMMREGGVVAWRNLLNLRRTPGALVTSFVQPVMFILLLAFVFGGSLGGSAYREFLIAGIMVQTLTFNASFTAVQMANELQKGLISRYRSLPMSPMAVILGRTTSDMTNNLISVAVATACGLAIGWRISNGVAAAFVGFALLMLFAFAVSWIGVVIGLTARSVEVAQSLGLIWLFPVTFISGAFVSVSGMPGPLRAVAEWNPVTAVATALRELFGNQAPAQLPPPTGWPGDNPLWYAILSSVAIIAIFAPLALTRFRSLGRE